MGVQKLEDFQDPQTVRRWLSSQREFLTTYLEEETVLDRHAETQPVWMVAGVVVVWEVPGGWALTTDLLCDHVLDWGDSLGSPRDAVAYFARHFRRFADALRATDPDLQGLEALDLLAKGLYGSAQSDHDWTAEHSPSGRAFPVGDDASAIRQTLSRFNQQLFLEAEDGPNDPELGPLVRMVTTTQNAPGGAFSGIYFFVDLSPDKPMDKVFNSLARRLLEIERSFAPSVGFRLQYALVTFGINFGEPARELEAMKQSDLMLSRFPELTERLQDYGAEGKCVLPMHYVDQSDTPWTAHAVLPFDPARELTPEDEYFNVRNHEFHQQMEQSDNITLRLIASSVDADVVQRARQAFAS